MKKYIDPFTINLPSLDLHGENRQSAIVLVDDFIKDNIKLRNKTIIIIHGKGSFVLRDFIHDYLKKDNRIESYNLDINTGQTIVNLKF
jgi:DNA mismatch repair protein MutS2